MEVIELKKCQSETPEMRAVFSRENRKSFEVEVNTYKILATG